MHLNLNHLRSFLVVAVKGNLSAAAKELNATQPHVGRQMTALSKELGMTILERHSRGVTLTEQGQEFFELCQRIIGQLEQETNIIKEKGSEADHILKILVGTGGTELIVNKLHLLKSQFPKLRFLTT